LARRNPKTKEQSMSISTTTPHTPYDPIGQHAAEAAMAWYGWGSPVGLAIAVIGVGIAAVLARIAVFGF
jgi:hypothetical protein